MARISVLVDANGRCLVSLCERFTASQTALGASLFDIHTRFEQWSRNIGARQPYEVSTSLERRVRAATKLQGLFDTRLRDLQEDLNDLSLALDEVTFDLLRNVPHVAAPNTTVEDDSSIENDPVAEITGLLKAAAENISALFRLSIVTRKAASRDRYARAQIRVLSEEVLKEELESEAIGHQFPTLRFPQLHWLRHRLTKANNARRRYLKYCEKHAKATAGSDNSERPSEANRVRESVDDQLESSTFPETQREGEPAEADRATISNYTTASTARDSIFDAIERRAVQADAESFISYATLSQLEAALSVPPLEITGKGAELFVCPYCQSEQAIASQAAWRRHVFADLRAYVCIHKPCELRMFESSEAWLAHELSEHLVRRHCPYCEEHNPINTESGLRSHLEAIHPNRFKSEQLSQLIETSTTEPDQVSTTLCHFCDWTSKLRYGNRSTPSADGFLVPVQRYRRHVGSHLEQVALLTITPITEASDTEVSSADDSPDNDIDDNGNSIQWIELMQLEGHTDCVRGAAFSPDGRLLASVSADRTARLWNVVTGEVVHRFDGYSFGLWAIAFSPDGSLLAMVSSDASVWIWQWEPVLLLTQLKGHQDSVLDVTFSPSGELIASASLDGTVRLWESRTWAEVRRLEGFGLGVRGVAFSPNGRLVATASDDFVARIWEVETGKEVKRLEGHKEWVRKVVFSSDGQLVVSASDDKTVRIWEVATGKEVMQLGHGDKVLSVAFSSSQIIAAASADGRVRLWDYWTGASILLQDHHAEVWAVAFSPDGRIVASTSKDGMVRLFATWRVAV